MTNMLHPGETVVKTGTFLYDSAVECDIRIVHSPIRYGSGDYEDPPDVQHDVECDVFYVHFGSTTQRGIFNACSSSFSSLPEAVAAVDAMPGVGSTILWSA